MIEIDILLRRHGGKRLPINVSDDSQHLQGCWRVVYAYIGAKRYDSLLQGLRIVEAELRQRGQRALPFDDQPTVAQSFRQYCRRAKLDCHVTAETVGQTYLFHIRPKGKTGRLTFAVTPESA